jgi:hypothetical protein
MKAAIVTGATIFIVVLLLAGCSTAPKTLTHSDATTIKRMAIVTRCPDQELKVLDRTGVWKKTYTGYQFGLLGGLIDGLVLSIESKIKIGKSLGGDPDLLREQLKDYPIKVVFDETFKKSFVTKYEIVHPDEVDIALREQTAKGADIEDYSMLQKNFDADTVLVISFIHGLAAYTGRPASATISADVAVVKTSDNTYLMKKRFDADQRFGDGHTIDEFAANSGELYKQNIVQAVGVISKDIEGIFDLERLQILSGPETVGGANSKDIPKTAGHEKRGDQSN